jgi:hypothetical protein
MKVKPDDPNEWVQWKLIESKLNERDILEFEAKLPYKLPPLFKAYLLSYCVLGMDFGDYYLPEISCDAPLRATENYALQPTLWAIGYGPFGGNPYGDPLCFDLQAPTPDGDYEIVVINHDMLSGEKWKNREQVAPYAMKVGGSFRDFLTGLCFEQS